MLLDPEWQHKVARVVWMGGAFERPDVLQELNAAYDPEATHLVMTSDAPLLIVPLDVTLMTYMHLEDIRLLESSASPLAQYLGRTVRPWVTWLADRFGRDGCPDGESPQDVALRADAGREPRHGAGVTLHEQRCGTLVASFPPRDEVEIGPFIGTLGDVCHAIDWLDAAGRRTLRRNGCASKPCI